MPPWFRHVLRFTVFTLSYSWNHIFLCFLNLIHIFQCGFFNIVLKKKTLLKNFGFTIQEVDTVVALNSTNTPSTQYTLWHIYHTHRTRRFPPLYFPRNRPSRSWAATLTPSIRHHAERWDHLKLQCQWNSRLESTVQDQASVDGGCPTLSPIRVARTYAYRVADPPSPPPPCTLPLMYCRVNVDVLGRVWWRVQTDRNYRRFSFMQGVSGVSGLHGISYQGNVTLVTVNLGDSMGYPIFFGAWFELIKCGYCRFWILLQMLNFSKLIIVCHKKRFLLCFRNPPLAALGKKARANGPSLHLWRLNVQCLPRRRFPKAYTRQLFEVATSAPPSPRGGWLTVFDSKKLIMVLSASAPKRVHPKRENVDMCHRRFFVLFDDFMHEI